MSKNTKSMVYGGIIGLILLWLYQRHQAMKKG